MTAQLLLIANREHKTFFVLKSEHTSQKASVVGHVHGRYGTFDEILVRQIPEFIVIVAQPPAAPTGGLGRRQPIGAGSGHMLDFTGGAAPWCIDRLMSEKAWRQEMADHIIQKRFARIPV